MIKKLKHLMLGTTLADSELGNEKFNIFWGIDSYAFKVTPQMIPINQSNISMTLGVTFPLYRRVNR